MIFKKALMLRISSLKYRCNGKSKYKQIAAGQMKIIWLLNFEYNNLSCLY